MSITTHPHTAGETIVTIRNMTKTFGPVTALRNVDVTVRRGQVLGLVGENGSGKSTVTSILSGMQKADSGTMTVLGRPWHPDTMQTALEGGVGMIVQENGTVPGITVAENLFLCDTDRFAAGKRGRGLINARAMRKAARKALDDIGADHIREDAVTATLDLQDRKLIEVARVWSRRPSVMVVDETTTALSQKGRDIIYDLMDRMALAGGAVVFISHDLDEIMAVCDALTVLRDGSIIRTFEKRQFDPDLIRQSMIGRRLVGDYYRSDRDGSASGAVVLKAEDVSVDGALDGVSLEARRGEIVGIGGLSQSGMHTLGKVLFGAVRPRTGTVTAHGEPIGSPADAMRHRIGYAAKDRDTESLCTPASIRENVAIAPAVADPDGLSSWGLMLPRREKRYTRDVIDSMQIKCIGPDQPVSQLSGGNKQKVVFGKWIGVGSDVLILDCPTRGIDVGVKQTMYRLLYKMKREGKTIIMISEELPELMGMSDRLLIMKSGRITAEFPRSESLTDAQIIGYMV
ncbi:MAG: sugar ABC transporter ATP-binding protein [Clostridia bacterium]|nr:sugar ABC transporter ATP-binding protein [Clostridia bacterium]